MKGKDNLEKNFISAVIYSAEDSHDTVAFLKSITSLLSANFAKFEIIVVVDNPNSALNEDLKKFAKKSKTGGNLNIVTMGYHQGLEPAMNAGVDLSIGDFVIQFDSIYIDYPIDVIMQAYRKNLEDNDIVVATPQDKQKLSSKLFYKLFNRHSNTPIPITTESFMIVSRRAINRVASMNSTIPYRKAIYASCGLNKKSITYKPLAKNRSPESHTYRRKVAVDSLILFTNISYNVAIFLSAIMMISSLILAIYAFTMFFSGKAIPGWTTLMLTMAFFFFLLFVVLAIIVKYLSLLVSLIFQKQPYIIKSIDKENI